MDDTLLLLKFDEYLTRQNDILHTLGLHIEQLAAILGHLATLSNATTQLVAQQTEVLVDHSRMLRDHTSAFERLTQSQRDLLFFRQQSN